MENFSLSVTSAIVAKSLFQPPSSQGWAESSVASGVGNGTSTTPSVMLAVQIGRHSTQQILTPCSGYYARFSWHTIGARHLVHGTPRPTLRCTTGRCACSASDAAGAWDGQEHLLPAAPGTAAGRDANASLACEDDGVMPSMDEADAIKQPPGRRSAEQKLSVACLEELAQQLTQCCCTWLLTKRQCGQLQPLLLQAHLPGSHGCGSPPTGSCPGLHRALW